MRVIGVSVIHFIVSSINIYHSFYCVLHHPTKPRILSLSLGSVSPPLICLDVDMAVHHCMCDIRTSYTQPTITIIANNTTLTAVRSLPSFSKFLSIMYHVWLFADCSYVPSYGIKFPLCSAKTWRVLYYPYYCLYPWLRDRLASTSFRVMICAWETVRGEYLSHTQQWPFGHPA